MSKLGWGILGTGNIAAKLARAINESESGKLVAVGSRRRESADEFAAAWHVPHAYATYDGVLSDPEVEAVYISLPNHLHAEWAIRSAEAGKDILCEKPLANDYAEAMAIVDAARVNGVFFLEAFMYRCSPQTARLAEVVASGAIGSVRLIETSFCYNMADDYTNIRLQNSSAGGAIMDVGCYTLSMARLIAGAALGKPFADPISFKAQSHIGGVSRVDEWSTATLRFPGDILANLNCACHLNKPSEVRVWGSLGHVVVDNPWFPGGAHGQEMRFKLFVDGKEAEDIVIPGGPALYTNEVDTVAHWRDLAREAPSPCMTLEDSLGNQRGLDAWREEVGLVFDAEKGKDIPPAAKRPIKRRGSARMRYGSVSGIDKPVSRLVMGSMVVHEDRIPYSYALLDNFYEIGGTAIDTAHVYGGGKSESAVGSWIRARGVRDEVFLIAKGAASIEADPAMVERELNQSLERFGLDSVDLYMMHRDNVNVPIGEFIECLNEHVRAGRIRAFGGSNWTFERLQAGNEYAKANNLIPFAASSPNFSLAEWNEPMWGNCVTAVDPSSVEWYRHTQMPLMAWSSQASGLFTGRYAPQDKDNPAASEVVRVWFNQGNFERLARVNELARKRNLTPTQIALAYVLSQPLNIFALIGPQSLEETRTSALALDVELAPEELAWLKDG